MDMVKMAAWAARREEAEREAGWADELRMLGASLHRKAIASQRAELAKLQAELDNIRAASMALRARQQRAAEEQRVEELSKWAAQREELLAEQRKLKAALVKEAFGVTQTKVSAKRKKAVAMQQDAAYERDASYIIASAASVRKTINPADIPARVEQLRASRRAAAARSREINQEVVAANAGGMAQTSNSRSSDIEA